MNAIAPLDPAALKARLECARTLAESTFLPDHFRGSAPNVFAALHYAEAWGVNPIIALQSLHMVNGRISVSASLVIALVNQSPRVRRGLDWRIKGHGEDLVVTAHVELVDGRVVEYPVPMSMVRAERWDKNPKYRTMPGHMMRFRSAVLLARLYLPEVLLGLHSRDELVDVAHVRGQADELVVESEPLALPTASPSPTSIGPGHSTEGEAVSEGYRIDLAPEDIAAIRGMLPLAGEVVPTVEDERTDLEGTLARQGAQLDRDEPSPLEPGDGPPVDDGGHHPSWTDAERRRFFAVLARVASGVRYGTLTGWLEERQVAAGAPIRRPSQMTQRARDLLLHRLEEPATAADLAGYALTGRIA